MGITSLLYFGSANDYSYDILTVCRGNYNCMTNSLESLSESENRQTVLKTFSGVTTLLNESGKLCHGAGHPLGHFIYDYSENLNEALSLIDRSCGGSLYHGVMMGYFTTKSLSDNGTPTNVAASNACNELHDVSYSQTLIQCAHGVGHGLVIAYNYDAFSAFEGCEVFEDEFTQLKCVGGIAMENAGTLSTPKGATLDEDDLLFPCSALDEKSAIACLRWHLLYVVRALDGSIEDAFVECEKNESETIVKYCYYGIGTTQFAGYSRNLENVLLMCQKGNLNYQNYCFAGAAYTIADQININQGFELCKMSPQTFQKDCYETLGKYIHTFYFTGEEIENACSQLKNTEYYQVCVNANPEELGLI